MDLSPTSPFFEELLALNPWAIPHWEARLALIDRQEWNLSSLNYSGNSATQRWLADFLPDRSRATLARLRGGGHVAWNAEIYRIVVPLLRSPDLADVWPGSPMKPVRGGALVNTSEIVEGYSPGQFLADVLMLGQASLHEVTENDPLDLSELAFTVGLRIYGGEIRDINLREARIGPFSDVITRFGRCDASGAEFYGNISFTTSRFMNDALFPSASFMGGCSFSAVQFDAASDFTGAQFDWSVQFAGTVFGETAIFDEAVFNGDATFEHSTFHASASFAGAKTNGNIYTGQIPPDVKVSIAAADRG